jgi:adenylate cyclase
MGDQTVKNIAKPVGAYRVFLEPIVVKPRKAKEKKPVRRMSIIVGAAVIIVLAIAAGTWHLHKIRLSVEPASVDKMAYPLPERPSIAVLPFDNLSGDSEQDYFSDGMTDDLITDLSKI